jgi:hypothetical protein
MTAENDFPARWIGREDQYNDAGKDPILLSVTYFCGREPKAKFTDQNEEHLIKWNNKFGMLVPLLVMMSQGKVLSLCFPCYRSMCKKLGPIFQSGTKGRCMGFQISV